MQYKFFLSTFLFFNLLLSANGQPTPREKRIDSLFSSWTSKEAPGYAIGITKNDKLVYQKYFGLANLQFDSPINDQSIFDVGSVSKQFTAACIAILQLQGKLSLNDTVRKYLTEFSAAYSKVKISNLIYHTAGIRQWEMLEMLANKSLNDYYTNDIILLILKDQNGLNFKPGEKYLYSNGGYIMLAEIIKRVSGKNLKDFARENIFQPLGMNNTFFVDDKQQIIKNEVSSYGRNDDKTFFQFVDHDNAYGASNLHTSIEDLSLWQSNFLHNKLVYGNDLTRLLLTQGKLNNGETIDYAFGIETGTYNGVKCISHTGFTSGFRTRMVTFPELEYSVSFITNIAEDIHSDSTAFDIAKTYSPELFIIKKSNPETHVQKLKVNNPGTRDNAPFKYSSKELSQFEGLYYCSEINKLYKIRSGDSALILQLDDDELNLVTKEKYKFSFQSAMILSFEMSNIITGFTLDVGDDVKGLKFVKLK
jgi:CubicO group peptidase (beta-lactamase class C family)